MFFLFIFLVFVAMVVMAPLFIIARKRTLDRGYALLMEEDPDYDAVRKVIKDLGGIARDGEGKALVNNLANKLATGNPARRLRVDP